MSAKQDDHEQDCLRIQRAIYLSERVMLSLEACREFWQSLSYSYAAGWLFLPDDDESIARHYRSRSPDAWEDR